MDSTKNNRDVDFPKSSNVILSAIRAVGYLKLHSHALEDSILRRLIMGKQFSSGATFCSSCNDESVGKHLRVLSLLSPRELQLVLKKPGLGHPILSPSCPSGKMSFKPSLDWKRRPLVTNYSYHIMKMKVKEAMSKKYGTANPNPNEVKLTVQEVAFFNPVSGLRMVHSNSERTDIPKVPSKRSSKRRISNNDAIVSTCRQHFLPTFNEAAPVPQVKLNSEGEVIIDPQSMRIRTSTLGTSKNDSQEGRREEAAHQNTKKWGFRELVKFYRGLFLYGTDFSLLAEFFPGRSRRSLKAKFKSEEMRNRDLVDRAVHTVNRTRADLVEIIRMLRVDRFAKSCGAPK
uniref:Transcription factor TFIIIB component B n=1 Tax=Lygus hesperus TaxID=30085 RepID=A0A0A9ZE62_LYGHE